MFSSKFKNFRGVMILGLGGLLLQIFPNLALAGVWEEAFAEDPNFTEGAAETHTTIGTVESMASLAALGLGGAMRLERRMVISVIAEHEAQRQNRFYTDYSQELRSLRRLQRERATEIPGWMRREGFTEVEQIPARIQYLKDNIRSLEPAYRSTYLAARERLSRVEAHDLHNHPNLIDTGRYWRHGRILQGLGLAIGVDGAIRVWDAQNGRDPGILAPLNLSSRLLRAYNKLGGPGPEEKTK